ncbi:MAG: hypothetical protein H6733_16565, partial [Alphaproteobacteria bacterium]|nr:hypothetical protein [Alphaproteobacteria bacterium]
ARLPADWLVRGPEPWPTTARGWLLRGGRNLLGGVLVVAGVAMLVLPGQGVLTILAGLVLVDVPGRKRVLVAVLRRPAVARGVAWIRERAEAPPLELPDDAR